MTVPARKDEALSGYMKAVVAGGDDGKILAAADEVAARAAGEPAKRQALYAKASVLRRTGRNSEALPLYERLGSDVSTPEGAEGAYRVIEAARAAGEMPVSRSSYMPSPTGIRLTRTGSGSRSSFWVTSMPKRGMPSRRVRLTRVWWTAIPMRRTA